MPSTPIQAQLNGESRELPAGTTVAALLQSLGLPADRVAVECNRKILKQPHWDSTEIQDGWTLEIVTFVGGG
jgi:sulfur carrier protein